MLEKPKGYDLIHRIPAEIGQRTRRKSETKAILAFLDQENIKKTDEILEVGSNLGYFSSKIFDKFGCSVTGIEPNPSKITKDISNIRGIGKGKDVIIEQADIMNLPYKDETIRVVNIGHVIEHFTDEETEQALSETRRVLVENGIVIVSVPQGSDVIANITASGHIQQFNTIVELQELLEKNGFEITKTKDTGYSFVVSGKKTKSNN